MERALAVRRTYAALETERFGREWTGEELMLGFVKDVGDLAALVQAKMVERSFAETMDELEARLG